MEHMGRFCVLMQKDCLHILFRIYANSLFVVCFRKYQFSPVSSTISETVTLTFVTAVPVIVWILSLIFF